VTEADQLVLGRFLRKGLFGKAAAEAAAQTGMRQTISKLVTEAEGSGQRDQVVSAHMLEAVQDTANDVHRTKMLQELDAAEREAADRVQGAMDGQFQSDMGSLLDDKAYRAGPCWPPPCTDFDGPNAP